MDAPHSSFSVNHLLNSLPVEDRARIEPRLERVVLERGHVLYEPDQEIEHIYFPERAMISVVAHTEDGMSAEVAVVGYEGATGVEALLGSTRAINEFITQIPNGALRMKLQDAQREFARGGAMQLLLLQFVRKMMVQASQTALCNRVHTTERRLSRWLLMCHDRVEGDKFTITQEFLAVMLGSTRTSVSITASELQKSGLITYTRGNITVLDRDGLEDYACTCYQVIRRAYATNGYVLRGS